MTLDVHFLIEGVRESRRYFLRHLDGVRDDQWDWKPYPECKTIRETLAHLITDDRAYVAVLEKGAFPDFEGLVEHETDIAKLLALLAESHEALCAFLRDKFADTPLDTKVFFFGGDVELAHAVARISYEDCYHAGQVAFIRMATDREWDYYRSVYGGPPE